MITGNRNDDGPDSLEATIRNENQPDSLPVITIADTDRVLQDRPYAHTVAERLLEKLIAIDDFRGTGRIYFPLMRASAEHDDGVELAAGGRTAMRCRSGGVAVIRSGRDRPGSGLVGAPRRRARPGARGRTGRRGWRPAARPVPRGTVPVGLRPAAGGAGASRSGRPRDAGGRDGVPAGIGP